MKILPSKSVVALWRHLFTFIDGPAENESVVGLYTSVDCKKDKTFFWNLNVSILNYFLLVVSKCQLCIWLWYPLILIWQTEKDATVGKKFYSAAKFFILWTIPKTDLASIHQPLIFFVWSSQKLAGLNNTLASKMSRGVTNFIKKKAY